MKTRRLALAGLLALPLLAGCTPPRPADDKREMARLQEQVRDQKHQIESLLAEVQGLRDQLSKARGFTEEDKTKIFVPEKIEILQLSGGDNYDESPGHDGVTVYLRPVDASGDALKVAGDIRVQLFDLENPPGETLVGECIIPAAEAAQSWYGSLMTYHFTIKCPWKRRPAHPEITVRVTFVDFLSQRVITAQTVVQVLLTEK